MRERFSVPKAHPIRKATLRRKLFLEPLEDRTLLSTYLVTSTGDNGGLNPPAGAGTGTLRQAIVDANAAGTGTAASQDLIQFNIPTTDPGYNSTTGAFSIKPLSALPTISDTLVLDGYTQPGASPNTMAVGDNAVLKIVLDGSVAGAVDGLVIGVGNSTVRGLVINNFAYGTALVLSGSGNDVVTGNFIGTDVTGESAAANNIGILTQDTSGNRIGGTSPAERNIISGNNSSLPDSADGGTNPSDHGIDESNSTHSTGGDNLIEGNYIGTDKSGTFALANFIGIFGGNNNTIGGLTTTPGTGAGNLISGNAGGISALDYQNLVVGNLIGTTATGMAALPNGGGIEIHGNYNTIGGIAAGSRNIVSGNFGTNSVGIVIEGEYGGGQFNVVEGNYVGTDITGNSGGLSNQIGIRVSGEYNTIGGNTSAARNIISGNADAAGVEIFSSTLTIGNTGLGNVVIGNYIGTDPSGTRAVPNEFGVRLMLAAHDNTIGGTLPGEGNLISGNNVGIELEHITANNHIQGNLIGTDKTGAAALGNLGSGIELDNDPTSNTIGGTVSGAGNVISGNGGNGIDIAGSGASGNVVEGNYIGTNAAGTAALANSSSGILITASASNNTIGGSSSVNPNTGKLTGAGNVISGNFASGVRIDGANNNLVAGNLIGTDATGEVALSNGYDEVDLFNNASGNTIGGASSVDSHGNLSGMGNLLSGGNEAATNGVDGIFSNNSSNNLIEGNFIGTDVTGQHALGGVDGVEVAGGSDNTIGGISSGTGNLISGNGMGIILLAAADGDLVEGNLIGTNASGTQALPNVADSRDNADYNQPDQGSNGVYLSDFASDNIIGGSASGAANIISGNAKNGIEIYGSGTTGNVIEGNYIGTNITGAATLANANDGVLIQGGASANTTGGTTAGAGNTIAFNVGNGVDLDSGTGNSILGNSIHDNTGLGIVLNSANDANDNQAAPVLTGVSSSGSGTAINGTLHSVASTTFRVEFFSNQRPDPTGFGQGQTFLGLVNVATDGTGNATFSATSLAAIPAGQGFVSATATNLATGDTSQFARDLVYNFSGFLPPLNQNMAFALNRTIPIKFQLTDLNGALITSLSAVTSLQVAPVLSGGGLGTPFNPTPTPGTGLRNDGSQYVFNWQTKGLTAGSYEILLTLADGTVRTKVIQLSANGSAGALLVDGSQTTTAVGALLGGNVALYVDNSSGFLTSDELARINDAVNAVDSVVEPYGVTITETSDSTSADVVLDMGTTSAVGGYANGVLGCTNGGQEITLITDWNWYAGADVSAIGSNQYDFETVVTHELGHALGLGHNTNAGSVMNATLSAGAVNRALSVADLNIADTDAGPSGLHAATATEDAKQSPAPALPAASSIVTINSTLANALPSDSTKFVSIQPAVAVEPTVNPANASEAGTVARILQHAAPDQALAQFDPSEEGETILHAPVVPYESPTGNLPADYSAPATQPTTLPEGKYEDVFGESPTTPWAVDEPGMELLQQTCDAYFAEDYGAPNSQSVVLGSVFAVALAANPTVLGDTARIRVARGNKGARGLALPKRGRRGDE
jgi:hypothetical protein